MQGKINQINDFGQVSFKLESGKNIFVENAVLGDVAEIEIIKENSKFILAKIKNLIEPSKSRVESPCKFFEKCGGCDFLNYEESFYQKTKSEILLKILRKNGILLDEENVEFHWLGKRQRRKVNLQIDENNSLGFFAKNSHELVKIDDCLLVEKEISALIPKLQNLLLIENGPRDKHGVTIQTTELEVVTPHLLRGPLSQIFSSISITLFDNSMDLVFKNKKHLNGLQKNLLTNFAKENNLNISLEPENKRLETIHVTAENQIFINNFKLNLHSQIFIQAAKSTLQIVTEKISNLIFRVCRQNNSEIEAGILTTDSKQKDIKNIVDFYCGFGAYSFAIIDSISSATLFEGETKMVKLIDENAKNLNLSSKIRACKRDLFLNSVQKKELNDFDLAIINPPRNGALPQVEEIAKSQIKNVVMVSCNPLTFARDAKILLKNGFVIENISAIDQFYSNVNFELVAIFKR